MVELTKGVFFRAVKNWTAAFFLAKRWADGWQKGWVSFVRFFRGALGSQGGDIQVSSVGNDEPPKIPWVY